MAAVQYAEKLALDGALPDWVPPPDATKEIVWRQWLGLQIVELGRLRLADQLRVDLENEKAVDTAQEQLDSARDNLRIAQASLKDELAYAESVSRMQDQTEEQLLALLAPAGEIAQRVAGLTTEIAGLREKVQAATSHCHDAVRGVQTVENPYSRAVFAGGAETLARLR